MGEITWEMRGKYGRHVDWIPAAVLERIDQDEILDRLDEANALVTKGDKLPADLMRGHMDRAREICAAEPRDEVERAAGKWLTKAESAYTSEHAEQCRSQARALRDANPSAPRLPRRPTPEQLRHAEALAAVKAEVAAQVAAVAPRNNALVAGIAKLSADVEGIRSATLPFLAK